MENAIKKKTKPSSERYVDMKFIIDTSNNLLLGLGDFEGRVVIVECFVTGKLT